MELHAWTGLGKSKTVVNHNHFWGKRMMPCEGEIMALFLVVLAAAGHALWNFILKKTALTGMAFLALLSVTEALLWTPIALVQVLWEQLLNPLALTAMALSAVLHMVYLGILSVAYRQGDLGLVYPIARATGPLLSMIFALLVLNETPGMLGIVGGLGIITGTLLVGIGSLSAKKLWLSQGVPLALLCGISIALYTIWDHYAVHTLALPIIGFYWGSQVLRGLFCLPWLARHCDQIALWVKKDWVSLLSIAALSPLVYVVVLWAMTMAPLSLVAPLRESSILFALLLGKWLLGETVQGNRALGAGLIVLGLMAMAAA
jgi:drug/metabolite transporter (DMT)-like permease